MLPFICCVPNQLLQQRETNFAIVQGVSKFTVLEDPRHGKPIDRLVQEHVHAFLFATLGVGMREQLKIRLIGNAGFCEGVVAIVFAPDRHENNFNVRIHCQEIAPPIFV